MIGSFYCDGILPILYLPPSIPPSSHHILSYIMLNANRPDKPNINDQPIKNKPNINEVIKKTPSKFKPINETICRKWIANPTIDPETQKPITEERKKALGYSCKWIGLYHFNPTIHHIAINDQMRSHEDRYVIERFNILYKTHSNTSVKVKYHLFAVIDGHNGSSTCDYIKRNLYQIIRKIMETKYEIQAAQDIRAILNSALRQLRTEIDDNIKDNSGAVMCALFSCQNKFVFGWIGDVRGVVYGERNKKIVKMASTTDHTFQNDMPRLKQERAVLKKDPHGTMRLHNLNIPRAFGDAEMTNIAGFSRRFELSQVFTYEPRMGRMYIAIGSDGMWNIMANKINYVKVMNNIILKYKMDQVSLTKFIREIRQRSNENDDITLVAITISL